MMIFVTLVSLIWTSKVQFMKDHLAIKRDYKNVSAITKMAQNYKNDRYQDVFCPYLGAF